MPYPSAKAFISSIDQYAHRYHKKDAGVIEPRGAQSWAVSRLRGHTDDQAEVLKRDVYVLEGADSDAISGFVKTQLTTSLFSTRPLASEFKAYKAMLLAEEKNLDQVMDFKIADQKNETPDEKAQSIAERLYAGNALMRRERPANLINMIQLDEAPKFILAEIKEAKTPEAEQIRQASAELQQAVNDKKQDLLQVLKVYLEKVKPLYDRVVAEIGQDRKHAPVEKLKLLEKVGEVQAVYDNLLRTKNNTLESLKEYLQDKAEWENSNPGSTYSAPFIHPSTQYATQLASKANNMLTKMITDTSEFSKLMDNCKRLVKQKDAKSFEQENLTRMTMEWAIKIYNKLSKRSDKIFSAKTEPEKQEIIRSIQTFLFYRAEQVHKVAVAKVMVKQEKAAEKKASAKAKSKEDPDGFSSADEDEKEMEVKSSETASARLKTIESAEHRFTRPACIPVKKLHLLAPQPTFWNTVPGWNLLNPTYLLDATVGTACNWINRAYSTPINWVLNKLDDAIRYSNQKKDTREWGGFRAGVAKAAAYFGKFIFGLAKLPIVIPAAVETVTFGLATIGSGNPGVLKKMPHEIWNGKGMKAIRADASSWGSWIASAFTKKSKVRKSVFYSTQEGLELQRARSKSHLQKSKSKADLEMKRSGTKSKLVASSSQAEIELPNQVGTPKSSTAVMLDQSPSKRRSPSLITAGQSPQRRHSEARPKRPKFVAKPSSRATEVKAAAPDVETPDQPKQPEVVLKVAASLERDESARGPLFFIPGAERRDSESPVSADSPKDQVPLNLDSARRKSAI